MKIRSFFALFLLLTACFSYADGHNSWQPKQIIVFGDGFSDNGNQYDLYKRPISPPYWHGRYSNGPIWAEDLAHSYGLIPNPALEPFYKMHTDFQDYAFGDAPILWRDRIKAEPTKTLDQQVIAYRNKNQRANNNTLAIIWVGAKDAAQPLCYKKPFRCVRDMNHDLKVNLNSLYKNGVRHFLMISVPDISKTPRFKKLLKPNTQKIISELIKYYNRQLAYTTYRFSQENKGANTLFLQINSFYKDTLSVLSVQNTNPCYSNFGNYVKKMGTVCPAPDTGGYFYFDDYYPTANVQSALSQVIHTMLENRQWQKKTATKASS